MLLDLASLLTIFPFFDYAGFARPGRMIYAVWRLLRALDSMASSKKNPLYLTVLFPFAVPLMAAVVYALDRHIPDQHHPQLLPGAADMLRLHAQPWQRPACVPVRDGHLRRLVLAGLMCIGIITNWVSNRYQDRPPASLALIAEREPVIVRQGRPCPTADAARLATWELYELTYNGSAIQGRCL